MFIKMLYPGEEEILCCHPFWKIFKYSGSGNASRGLHSRVPQCIYLHPGFKFCCILKGEAHVKEEKYVFKNARYIESTVYELVKGVCSIRGVGERWEGGRMR
jgi:hypothetical protein